MAMITRRLLVAQIVGSGVISAIANAESKNRQIQMNTSNKISWFESAMDKLTGSSEFQHQVVDEYWASLALPTCRNRKTGFTIYYGNTRKAPDGLRDPQSPHIAAWVSYPESTVDWFVPKSNEAHIDSGDLKSLRNEAVMAGIKNRLTEKGKWMRRHKALIDQMLTQGWFFDAIKNFSMQREAAKEWKMVLANLIEPQFFNFYQGVAHDLTDWINRRTQ